MKIIKLNKMKTLISIFLLVLMTTIALQFILFKDVGRKRDVILKLNSELHEKSLHNKELREENLRLRRITLKLYQYSSSNEVRKDKDLMNDMLNFSNNELNLKQ